MLSGTIGWDERRVIDTEWWEYASSVNVVWGMFSFASLDEINLVEVCHRGGV